MGPLILLPFWFVHCYSGVGALTVETQNGLSVRVDMASHVYTDNQTDQLRFEVKSCGEVNISFIQKRGIKEKLSLKPATNESSIYQCFNVESRCNLIVSKFGTPDFCSESVAFWVMIQRNARKIGSGCSPGDYLISEWILPIWPLKYKKMELESNSSAFWKLGASVCVPPTTTVSQPTMSTQSSGTTDQSVTTEMTDTDLTSPDTQGNIKSLECPTEAGSYGKSSSVLTHSATWLMLISLILCQ